MMTSLAGYLLNGAGKVSGRLMIIIAFTQDFIHKVQLLFNFFEIRSIES